MNRQQRRYGEILLIIALFVFWSWGLALIGEQQIIYPELTALGYLEMILFTIGTLCIIGYVRSLQSVKTPNKPWLNTLNNNRWMLPGIGFFIYALMFTIPVIIYGVGGIGMYLIATILTLFGIGMLLTTKPTTA